jgi:hypothetical protein
VHPPNIPKPPGTVSPAVTAHNPLDMELN